MTYLVPFDGSDLSEAALAKARVHAISLDEAPSDIRNYILRESPLDVVAVSIVPEGASYAREKGWIGEDEEFRTRLVVERLHEQVTELDPSAKFDFERVDAFASSGTISTQLRRKAEEYNASMVFIGSENAGSIVTPLSSVGAGVTSDEDFDVCIIRHTLPAEVKHRLKSEFFFAP